MQASWGCSKWPNLALPQPYLRGFSYPSSEGRKNWENQSPMRSNPSQDGLVMSPAPTPHHLLATQESKQISGVWDLTPSQVQKCSVPAAKVSGKVINPFPIHPVPRPSPAEPTVR